MKKFLHYFYCGALGASGALGFYFAESYASPEIETLIMQEEALLMEHCQNRKCPCYREAYAEALKHISFDDVEVPTRP